MLNREKKSKEFIGCVALTGNTLFLVYVITMLDLTKSYNLFVLAMATVLLLFNIVVLIIDKSNSSEKNIFKLDNSCPNNECRELDIFMERRNHVFKLPNNKLKEYSI